MNSRGRCSVQVSIQIPFLHPSIHQFNSDSANIIVSGEVPEDPVVSVKSGHVFERRLIEKYIAEHGTCPITSQTLTVKDLLAIQNEKVVRPRPVSATSIPSLLSTMQNEWDALMLETFTMRKQLESVRQELSHALFQHDAACRVIARLVRERDAARSLPEQSNEVPEVHMQIDNASVLSEEIIEEMTKTASELSKGRKKRAMPEDLATADEMKSLKEVNSIEFHGKEHFTCLDIQSSGKNVITGLSETHVKLFRYEGKKASSSINAHEGRINQIVCHKSKDLVFSCSDDRTICIIDSSDDKLAVRSKLELHKAAVSGISLHATGNYLCSASLDKSWNLIDLNEEKLLRQIDCEKDNHEIACIQFHPDGLILGTGAGSVVKIWDCKTQENVMTFTGHGGQVSHISFSENGYYLATSARDNIVKLWDLRKLENIYSIDMGKSVVNAIEFDYSGQYLAVGGNELRVIQSKTWNELYKMETPELISMKFTRNSRQIVAASVDNTLKYYGLDA